jgi:2-dehydro-3-deoxygluconokinase
MSAMPKTLDIVAIGEPLVEFNQRGTDPRDYRMGFGGDTSNCVVAAARLGARCACVTQVGDDAFGHALLALWQREQVGTEGVGVIAGAPTGVYFVSHGPDGHRFSYRRHGSAASLMQAARLPRALIESARYLHCSGISQAISDSALLCVAEAIAVARSAGTRVSYDLNFRPALVSASRALELARQTLPHCDLFFPSVDEIRVMTGLDQPRDVIAWSHDQGARRVVLKLGAQGCMVSEDGELLQIPGVPVTPVDATGAGDCFAGACLSQLARGSALADAARVANVAAALSTQGYGAIDPLPHWAEVARKMGAGSSSA